MLGMVRTALIAFIIVCTQSRITALPMTFFVGPRVPQYLGVFQSSEIACNMHFLTWQRSSADRRLPGEPHALVYSDDAQEGHQNTVSGETNIDGIWRTKYATFMCIDSRELADIPLGETEVTGPFEFECPAGYVVTIEDRDEPWFRYIAECESIASIRREQRASSFEVSSGSTNCEVIQTSRSRRVSELTVVGTRGESRRKTRSVMGLALTHMNIPYSTVFRKASGIAIFADIQPYSQYRLCASIAPGQGNGLISTSLLSI